MSMATISSAAGFTGVASVVDGDTIEIHGNACGSVVSMRQKAAKDAWELWMCGQKDRVGAGQSDRPRRNACRQYDTDRYGRAVASCEAVWVDLNACMVRQRVLTGSIRRTM
jgi:endonuclease YncB( thermonuclease family)